MALTGCPETNTRPIDANRPDTREERDESVDATRTDEPPDAFTLDAFR
jgi:hypothetical protein